jgi:dolichol kinase
MKIIIPTMIYYALGAAFLASIHAISAHEEVIVVSCYLCGRDDNFGIPLLSKTPHAHLFSFPL